MFYNHHLYGASITYGLLGLYQKKTPFEDDYKEKYYKHMSKFSTKRKTIHRSKKCRKFTNKGQLELTERSLKQYG